MTALYKLFKTTTFRLSLIFLIYFGVASTLAIGYIYWNAKVLLISQLNQTVEAEIQGLAEQYRQGGLPLLARTVAERSRTPGNSLYLVTDPSGRYLAGNLRANRLLRNTSGKVRFKYSRPAPGGLETRDAYAKGFLLPGDYRLLVGRDIQDRTFFDRVISDVLIGMGLITFFGIIGGWLVSRNILSRIDGVTAASKTIMDGDLSERIPTNGSGDEIDRLSINLNEMLDKIERLMNGLREVSDNIAHDLKTPLNRMRNRIDAALRDNIADPAHKDIMQATIEDADNLIQTFNALLSIARLEAGAGSQNMRMMDLTSILTDLAELYEPVLEENNLTLKTDLESPVILTADRQLIGQAIANLIDNAVKYAATENTNDTPSNVLLVMKKTKNHAEVTLADHGPGIPEADRERVLQRFVRLEKSRSLPGSGLGLSLVSAVAQLHGGELILENNNPGLKAILRIPIREQNESKTKDKPDNTKA